MNDLHSPHEILHPKNWKTAKGYANGIAATGRMVFTGGIVGWNTEQEWESDDFAAQVAQCLLFDQRDIGRSGAEPRRADVVCH